MSSKYILGLLVSGLSLGVIAQGCGGDSNDDGDGGQGGETSTPSGSSSSTTGGAGGKGGNGGDAPTDEGTSCADAIALEEDELQGGVPYFVGRGVINPAGDADFFKLTVTEDKSWFAVGTTANEEDDPELVDTVITIFSEDGKTQLAQVDDAFPRVSTDSELYTRFLTKGTYCIKVEEYSTWDPKADPEGGEDFEYEVWAIPLDLKNYVGFSTDVEPNENTETATPAKLRTLSEGSQAGQVATDFAGELDLEGDVDVFSFKTPAQAVNLSLSIPPWGNEGFGATSGPGFLRLLAADGQVIAELDAQKGSDELGPPVLPETDYFIQINRSGGALGANDFYFLRMNTFNLDTTPEAEVGAAASNNSVATAETIVDAVEDPQDGKRMHYYVRGEIDSSADVDFFKFPATAGDSVSVSCGAARSGSGLIEATFSLETDSASLQSEVETADADVLWTDARGGGPTPSKGAVKIGTSGDYYFKISATGQTPNVLSKFYRCGIHIQSP